MRGERAPRICFSRVEEGLMSAQTVGYILAVAQAILYSTMGVAAKFLYGTGLTPEQVILLRFLGTVVVLGAFLLVWRKQPLFSRRPIVYVQGVFFALCAIFYFLAVDEMTANVATVLFYAYPAMVALLATFVLKERLTARILVSLAVAMAGIVLISGVVDGFMGTTNIEFSPIGVLYGILSCAAFAVYNVIGQKAVGKKDGPMTMTFSMCVVGSIMMIVAFPTYVPTLVEVNALQLGVALFIVVCNTIVPVVMLLEAIKRIGAMKSSLIGISETPFALAFAFVILSETLTVLQGAGAVLVVISILLVTLPSKKSE